MESGMVKKIYNINNIPITVVKNFFDNLGTDMISTSLSGQVLTVRVDNIVNIEFNKANLYHVTVYDESGNRVAWTQFNTTSPNVPPYTFSACFSDTFFYLQYSDSSNRRLLFVYEIIDGNRYFGAIGSQDTTGTPWYPITSVPLKQVENQNYYNHIQMLSYTAPLNYIDYSADILFKDGTTLSDYTDTNTLTCTTVTQDTIFTFGAHNYYSLGPNTLIRITQR